MIHSPIIFLSGFYFGANFVLVLIHRKMTIFCGDLPGAGRSERTDVSESSALTSTPSPPPHRLLPLPPPPWGHRARLDPLKAAKPTEIWWRFQHDPVLDCKRTFCCCCCFVCFLEINRDSLKLPASFQPAGGSTNQQPAQLRPRWPCWTRKRLLTSPQITNY